MLTDTIVENRIFRQKNGIVYYWDLERSKWISVFRETFFFNYNNKNIFNTIWLRKKDNLPSNIIGYLVNRNSIITSISSSCKESLNTNFIIYKKNINIYSLDLENKNYKVDDNLDIDVEKGDDIKCLMEVENGYINYPTVSVEIAIKL